MGGLALLCWLFKRWAFGFGSVVLVEEEEAILGGRLAVWNWRVVVVVLYS